MNLQVLELKQSLERRDERILELERENEALKALLASTAVPVGDGWCGHDGGPMPVDDEERVLVRFRDGEEIERGYLALNFRWNHENCEKDIVAWKPAPAATKKDEEDHE